MYNMLSKLTSDKLIQATNNNANDQRNVIKYALSIILK